MSFLSKKIIWTMITTFALLSFVFASTVTVLPISADAVDSDAVREIWLQWINDARFDRWSNPYILDPYLTNTAQTRANHLRDNDITQWTHIREDEAFRDSAAIRRWFEAQGVTPWLFTESNGRNVYRCSTDCTQTMIEKIRYTYDFFVGEAGKSYQPHRLSVIGKQYKIMGVGIAAGNGKYYLTMQVADHITVNDPSLIFSDTAGHQYRESIEYLYNRGIIQWYPDKTFRPDLPISRAEMTKIVVAARTLGTTIANKTNCFPDVRTEWFAPYVCYAKTNNIIKWFSDGLFRPQSMATVAQWLKIWLNAFSLGIVEWSGSNRYTPYLDYVYANAIFPSRSLHPDNNMTRGQMAYLVHQLLIK
ncbi:MAG: amidase [uncultured bacterium (gcode 4)]|uniref:Amidase n=1 Tax=uncultured bacterium (gcode 4) TaxID=1234023 RepID=K1XJA9_9BACT|nr:MAG: amidase [uncultured bacterium (gcode 4)]